MLFTFYRTWNNLLEPCNIEFVATNKLEFSGRKQEFHLLIGGSVQFTVTETWLQSILSWITRWKDVSVMLLSKVSSLEVELFESSIESSKKNMDNHSGSTDFSFGFDSSHSRRSVLIRYCTHSYV